MLKQVFKPCSNGVQTENVHSNFNTCYARLSVWCTRAKTTTLRKRSSRPDLRNEKGLPYTIVISTSNRSILRGEKKCHTFRLIRTFGSAVKDVVKRPQNGLIHQLPAGCRSIFHQEQAETQSFLVANRCTRSEQRVLGH